MMKAAEMKDVEYGLTGSDRNDFGDMYYWEDKYLFRMSHNKKMKGCDLCTWAFIKGIVTCQV